MGAPLLTSYRLRLTNSVSGDTYHVTQRATCALEAIRQELSEEEAGGDPFATEVGATQHHYFVEVWDSTPLRSVDRGPWLYMVTRERIWALSVWFPRQVEPGE